MLAMPLAAASVGFLPSFCVFLLSALFMLANALLILELCLKQLVPLHFVSLSEQTLGFWAKIISSALFIFLFYSLMMAYIAGSEMFLGKFFFSSKLASFILVLILFFSLYMGTKVSDLFNQCLFVLMLLIFSFLLFGWKDGLSVSYLSEASWGGALAVFPIGIVGFGFHQMIPTLTTYLNYDKKRLELAFLLGTFLVLATYLLWQAYVFALFPKALLQDLIKTNNISELFVQRGLIFHILMDLFAFFALLTSFLGVSLSFVDFFADLFSWKKTPYAKALISSLVLLPPWILVNIYPGFFLKALDLAGGIAALALFGLFPPLMVWNLRYVQNVSTRPCLFGGKALLIFLFLCSLSLLLIDCAREFSFLFQEVQ